MPLNPWYTSDELVSAIQRKIMFPLSQNTFGEQDILDFCNEEMMIAQVPSVMEYHQEFFVETFVVPLQSNISNYQIPNRAIGMKLRDIFYLDNQNNFVEMTRVNSDDRAFFQANIASSNSVYKFYLQGNDIIVTPAITSDVYGALMMVYFLRPNALVPNDNAAHITNFLETITVNNTYVNVGDTVTIGGNIIGESPLLQVEGPFPPYQSNIYSYNSYTTFIPQVIFTAISGSPLADQFLIGATSALTAQNLATAINTDGTYSATVMGDVVTINYTNILTQYQTSNTTGGFVLNTGVLVQFDSIPSMITNGSTIDVLQTVAGHKTKAIDIVLGSNAISGNVIQLPPIMIPQNAIASGLPITPSIPSDLSPYNMAPGDYICLAGKCIIPQVPTDLHISLIERVCSRILASLGDLQGMQVQEGKIAQVEKTTGTLIDNRVEGSPMKVLARHSLARFGKMGPRRNLS